MGEGERARQRSIERASMDPYRAFNCEPRIKNRGGPGAVVKCNGFAWFSLALSARACLRSISLKFRMCSAAPVATTWGLHDAKWRCSKNAFREEPDYLADCTVRDAMVVPPCFRLFASAPPPDRARMAGACWAYARLSAHGAKNWWLVLAGASATDVAQLCPRCKVSGETRRPHTDACFA